MNRINRYNIGRKADRLADHADRLLVDGKIGQTDHDLMLLDIRTWESEQYRIVDAKLQRRAS